MKYAVVMERAERNFSAFVPDLPGCIATADSIQDLEVEIRKAITFHIDGLKEDGLPVPEPSCSLGALYKHYSSRNQIAASGVSGP